MATEYKIGGQADLAATTLTDIYVVPVGKKTIISAITFTNRNASNPRLVRLAIAQNGAADNNKQYLFWDVAAAANDVLAWTAPLTLSAGDVVRALSSDADVNAQVFVQESDA